MKRLITLIIAGVLWNVHGYALGDSTHSVGLGLHLTSAPGLTTMGGAQGLTVKAASGMTIAQGGTYERKWAAETFLPAKDLEDLARYRSSLLLAEKATREPQGVGMRH